MENWYSDSGNETVIKKIVPASAKSELNMRRDDYEWTGWVLKREEGWKMEVEGSVKVAEEFDGEKWVRRICEGEKGESCEKCLREKYKEREDKETKEW